MNKTFYLLRNKEYLGLKKTMFKIADSDQIMTTMIARNLALSADIGLRRQGSGESKTGLLQLFELS